MDFESIARSIGNQFVTVWNAPIPFLAALLVVGYVIWRICQWQHGVRIAHLTSQLELYREATTIGAASAAPATPAEREAPQQPEPQAGPRPPASLRPAKRKTAETGPRVLLDDSVSLQTLRDLSATGATTIAGQLAAERYVGKWMKLEGKVENVVSGGLSMVMVTLQNDKTPGRLPLTNLFFRDHLERVSALEAGQMIKAIGRFTKLTPIALMFYDCELLEL